MERRRFSVLRGRGGGRGREEFVKREIAQYNQSDNGKCGQREELRKGGGGLQINSKKVDHRYYSLFYQSSKVQKVTRV